jgi:hypothetical protein
MQLTPLFLRSCQATCSNLTALFLVTGRPGALALHICDAQLEGAGGRRRGNENQANTNSFPVHAKYRNDSSPNPNTFFQAITITRTIRFCNITPNQTTPQVMYHRDHSDRVNDC